MATDRQFTNPNFGSQARVEVDGCEVRLVFVASDRFKANDLADRLLEQLKQGSVTLTMMGQPTSIVEE
jgi:hypothetical protein